MKILSDEKSKGNTGEAIFEAIISPHAIPHKVDGSKDIGVDFLCEWKKDDNPTGIIFLAQVKNYPSKTATFVAKDTKLNLLDTYTISPTVSIDQETQEYWKLLGLPCYLFITIPNGNSVDLFYKRYTPIVTVNASQSKSPFYKANNEFSFLAFADQNNKVGGFIRDLYIDQMRSNYNKGLIGYLNPRRLGLMQFPDQDSDIFFKDIFKEYRANFEKTFQQLKSVFDVDGQQQATPSQSPPPDEPQGVPSQPPPEEDTDDHEPLK